jgi:hypothetical protein
MALSGGISGPIGRSKGGDKLTSARAGDEYSGGRHGWVVMSLEEE